jgi:hypothetical protein
MDDLQTLEQRLAREMLRRAGPSEPVDDAAIFTAVSATRSTMWRFPTMFDTLRFVIAGAVVATFGSFLVSGTLPQRSNSDPLPAAMTIGSSCPEAEAYEAAAGTGITAASALATPVSGTGFLGEQAVNEAGSSISAVDGYARISFLIDQEVEADDPRLSGHFTGRVTAHFFDDSTGVVVGDIRIENASGSWTGSARGQSTTQQAYQLELTGDGAYSGCGASLGVVGAAQVGDMFGVIYPLEALATTE